MRGSYRFAGQLDLKVKNLGGETTFLYRLVSALVAFLLWGGWAFFANGGAGKSAQVWAGAVQGSASFVITFIMVWAVTGFIRILPDSSIFAFMPAIMTVAITSSGLILIHHIAGTPNIIATILPPISVALAYCLFTNHKIRKARQLT